MVVGTALQVQAFARVRMDEDVTEEAAWGDA